MNRFNGFLGVGLLGLMLGVGSMSLAACGDDDDDNGTTQGSGGGAGTGGKGGGSGTGGGAGTGGTAGGSGASGSAGSGGGTLSPYERLGGKAGIRKFVGDEVAKTLQDPILSTYFFRQVQTPIPEGSPSGKQIIECFSRFVAVTVGEKTEKYAGGDPVNDPENTNTPNFTCREDFKAMHAGLKIGDATFDAFVTVLATDLMPLVVPDGQPLVAGKISQSEFTAVANALTGTKDAVTDNTAGIINDRNVKFEDQP